METVAIVGVGLIGGSFALALKKAGFTGRIIGVSSPRTIEEALRLRVIDEALPLEEAAARSDLIYLSQPISRILDTLTRLDASLRPGALVTDAGSTKAEIVQRATGHLRRGRFLGGHPMAGKETRGVAAAEPDLFRGRTYVLTPVEASELDSPPARELLEWIRGIGARPLFLSPDQHDRVVAFASHLPQLASTALAAALGHRSEAPELTRAAGPGLLDTTRLALSSYDIWADILATNSANIEDALTAYIDKLNEIRKSLASEALRGQFDAASDFARRMRAEQG